MYFFQSKNLAELRAEKVNAKIGYQPKVEEKEEAVEAAPVETFKRYEEELEINEFPQTARWKVTNKVCVPLMMPSQTISLSFMYQYLLAIVVASHLSGGI